MKLIKENEGMQLSEDEGKFYLQYDAGAHIIKKFNEWLCKNQWSIKLNKNNNLNLNAEFIERYSNFNDEYSEFLKYFAEVTSDDEKTWFLCQNEYNNISDLAFKWNEFEKLSLEVAEDDKELKKDIKQWWDKKLPIIISVKDGYTFFAIDLENNSGEIVRGEEPEFEETKVVANSFFEFLDMVIKEKIVL